MVNDAQSKNTPILTSIPLEGSDYNINFLYKKKIKSSYEFFYDTSYKTYLSLIHKCFPLQCISIYVKRLYLPEHTEVSTSKHIHNILNRKIFDFIVLRKKNCIKLLNYQIRECCLLSTIPYI